MHTNRPHTLVTLAAVGLLVVLGASASSAQSLGPFRWQFQPFCNVVALTAVAGGPFFSLSGADDQCGAGAVGTVSGTASIQSDGTVAMGLTIVTAPGVLVGAQIRLTDTVGLSGTWHDTAGNSGTFLFNPALPAGGAPRPAPAPSSGGPIGDITAVLAGPGLTGGGSSGDVMLAVAFGADGAAMTVAHSDHGHGAPGVFSIALGGGLINNTGNANTAVGDVALIANVTGGNNTAVGKSALQENMTGSGNTAVGKDALGRNLGGNGNTAVGQGALRNNTTGSNNIALGGQAGAAATTGSNNIYIGHAGVAGEPNTIRIGTPGTQSQTFIAGIRDVTTVVPDGLPVLIDSAGQLGVMSSTRRVKQDIEDMGDTNRGLLRLRPVTFRYRQPSADGWRPPQFGLIAEEVAEVFPELVVFDDAGRPFTVRYHVLPVFLLNELQRQDRELAAQAAKLAAQSDEIATLWAAVETLRPRLGGERVEGRVE